MNQIYPDAHAQAGGYQQWRQMTINDLLMENRIVFIDMPLSSQMYMQYGGTFATDVIKKLLRLQYLKKYQDIHLYINCPGGSIGEILAIYDTMRYMTCDINTYCVGVAYSGAALLLAAGTKGKRFCLPHSKVMIHQPWGGVTGQAEDISIQAEQIVHERRVLNELLSHHTGQPIEKIELETERDRYLTAPMAKDYGLIDEILEPEKKNAGPAL
ncbi:MAG: ATP-dependent Clp protease proteolytic subunit [Phycisphaerae bacterium]|nr:ATP-dependent Clp protease proteolytic subunit [Phycisphaerae bacterium]